MSESFRKSLPTMKMAGWSPSQVLSGPRARRIQKSLYNLQMTVICMFVTVVMLRGMLGAGKFGTPNQDLDEIRNHLAHRDRSTRTMMEFTGSKTDDEAEGGDSSRWLLQKDFDPVKYFDPETVHHTLGEHISDWDEQRAAFMAKNKGANQTNSGKARTLLVSGSQPKPCDNPMGDYFLLKNLKNKVDYCRLHDIDIFYNMAHMDLKMSGFWAKLPLLRKLLLSHPDVEWIWWMDSDAFFTDMKFELPMENYENYNMVVHGWYNMIYEKKSWIGLNTGSFLIRNCQWTLDILDAWAPFGPNGKPRTEAGKLFTKYLQGRPEFEADDQSALIYLLLSQREKWSEKTYLESSFFLHGYWVILVENFEKMMDKYHPGLGDERWPFVTHFVGCKPCHGSSGDYSAERCAKQMERAFNFADNQVLEAYGYVHPNLHTTAVTKLPGGSSSKTKSSADQPILRGGYS
ncbi:xyloglucan 6-xylosyltransferase [Marchantia polymorpha subsp. ruderalis]